MHLSICGFINKNERRIKVAPRKPETLDADQCAAKYPDKYKQLQEAGLKLVDFGQSLTFTTKSSY